MTKSTSKSRSCKGPPENGGWFWIENATVPKLTALGKASVCVYLALGRRTDANRICHPSISTIAADAGCARSSVQTAVKQLAAAGLVEIEKQRFGKSTVNVYRLTSVHIPIAGTSNDVHVPIDDPSRTDSATFHVPIAGTEEDKGKKTQGRRQTPTPLPKELDTEKFRTAWTEWQQHRREIKKPLTPTSTSRQLASFVKWGETRAIAAIEHTIEKGWTGIQEPDQQRNGQPKPRLDIGKLMEGIPDYGKK